MDQGLYYIDTKHPVCIPKKIRCMIPRLCGLVPELTNSLVFNFQKLVMASSSRVIYLTFVSTKSTVLKLGNFYVFLKHDLHGIGTYSLSHNIFLGNLLVRRMLGTKAT